MYQLELELWSYILFDNALVWGHMVYQLELELCSYILFDDALAKRHMVGCNIARIPSPLIPKGTSCLKTSARPATLTYKVALYHKNGGKIRNLERFRVW